MNHVSGVENTALNAAATYGHLEVVQVLMERGADVCDMSAGGTAGYIARSRGYKEVAELHAWVKVLRCKGVARVVYSRFGASATGASKQLAPHLITSAPALIEER